MCARRRSGFLLLRQKKVTKEKAPLQAASLRFAAGNLWCSRPAGSRSNSLRSAQPVQRVALAPARWGRAQRWPVELLGCSPPSGCACGGAVAGWHARQCAHASSTDSPWLSERRAQRKASSTAHPATAPTQVFPEGAADGGSPFFGLLFFGEAKKSESAAGPRPGLRPQPKHTNKPALNPSASSEQASSARTQRGNLKHLKNEAPPARSPPHATPQTTPAQSTHPPPSH